MLDISLTPPPVWGCLPFSCTLTKLLASLCIGIFQGYWYAIWGFFPSVGFGGCSPSIGGSGGISKWMSICSFLYIFVVCYFSCFYSGYDYYSSSYGGIFQPVFSFISDCGSFPEGISSKLGSAWIGSATTLDAKRLWGVIASASVPQQQPPSLMPLLAYVSYAMGSPQVGFFFRVEPPIILYITCLVSILVSAF